MKRLIAALTSSMLLLTFVASTALAQHWEEITTSLPYGPHLVPYFLNSKIGFTYSTGISEASFVQFENYSTPYLSRTTDGGATWSSLTFFDTMGYIITQLCFVSAQHGYASTYSILENFVGQYGGGIFETFDQGDHWKLISKNGNYLGVYAVGSTVFAAKYLGDLYTSNSIGAGPILFSRDDGITWNSITNVSGLSLDASPQFQFIYGNRDSLVATVYYHPVGYASNGNRKYDTYLVFSTDQGQSWQSRAFDQATDWGMTSLHISPHSCDIIRESVNFQDQTADKYLFLKSSPDYRTWSPSIHDETGAWIAGNNCALYLSNAGFDIVGVPLYWSTDGAATWQGLPGGSFNQPNCKEIDDEDWQNISVVGHGAIVYTADMNGNLWKTTDGGDGTLSESTLAPQIAIAHAPFASANDTLDVNLCSPSSLVISYQNIGCSYASFESISIDGLDSNEYTETSTHHRSCEWTPDTTFITLYPKTAGIRNITVHPHFVDDEYNEIDSTVPVTLNVKSGNGASVGLNIYLKPAPILVASGDTIEIPIYLNGTDPEISLSGTTTAQFALTYDPITTLPLDFTTILPGVIETGPISIANGLVSIDLQSASGLTLSGETIIGTLRCVIYLSNTLRTSISLASASIASNDPRCLALSTTADAATIDITGCGDSTLLHYMKNGTMSYSIERISPNPASNTINIMLHNESRVPLHYELTDALGVPRASGSDVTISFQIDIRTLPEGVYYLRIMDPRAGRGSPITRAVAVER
ncbi:MAG TPA: T9SS type A sorting domain-containing protein [Candidatus Kapabacteria bacterium]|jgi:hypothetical protein|nr:T9SS type A sorting domain-containing protein [Candidatus Kapabacteria bacterium]